MKATRNLKLPPDASVIDVVKLVNIRLEKAGDDLAADRDGAESAMKAAAEAFLKLEQQTPALAERRTRVGPELDKIRMEQNAIAAQVEQLLKGTDRALIDATMMKSLAANSSPYWPGKKNRSNN